MKKILFLVFLLVLVVPVKGLESDDVTIKYKYYRLNKVLGPMVLKDEVSDEFPLIDETNYLEGELSELSPMKPLDKDGRKIYEYDGYHYLKVPKINAIELEAGTGEIINDIKIKNAGEEIAYTGGSKVLIGNNLVRYDLNGAYNLNDLIITGKSGDGKDTHIFNIYFKYNDKLISNLNTLTCTEDITLHGNLSLIKSNAYENIYSLEKTTTSFDLIYKGEIKLYQYQDYKYQSYKLEREYYDKYLTEPYEDYIYRDESDYIEIPIINNVFTSTNLLKDQPKPVLEETKKVNNNKINLMNVKNTSFKNESSKKPAEIKLPTQYQHVLKVGNKKTTPNVANTNHFYDYLKIIILIILLILTLKLKNKVKEYSR